MSAQSNLSIYQQIGVKLINRWRPLLEGLGNRDNIMNMALLLENTWQHAFKVDGMPLSEATTSTGTGPSGASPQIAVYRHYLMSLIRRTYPQQITNGLIGIQPMTSAVSQLFYLKYFYNGMVNQQDPTAAGAVVNKGSTAAGTEYGNFAGDTWFVDPYYSLQTIKREPLSTGGGTIGAGVAAGAAGTHAAVQTAMPILDNSTKLYVLLSDNVGYAAATNVCLVEITGWTNAVAAAPLTGTVLGYLKGSTVPTNTYTGNITSSPNTFTLNFAAGNYGFILSTAQVAVAVTAGSTFLGMNTIMYDVNMESRSEMPELSLEITSASVTAEARKMRTVWSPEAVQDMRSMHQVDAEAELVSLMSSELAAEMDREALNDLIINAGHRRNYNYSDPFLVGGFAVGGGTGMLNYSQSASLPSAAGNPWYSVAGSGNFDDRNKALYYQVIEQASDIYRQTLRGAANWIVTSPQIAAKFEELKEYRPNGGINGGIRESGMLQDKFRLIVDPLFPEDLILTGYKGASNLDSGYFRCPYVPIALTPTIIDPRNFNNTKGIMSRYGKVMVENGERFYGIIKVANLGAVGVSIPSGYPIQTSTTVSGSDLNSGNTDLV